MMPAHWRMATSVAKAFSVSIGVKKNNQLVYQARRTAAVELGGAAVIVYLASILVDDLTADQWMS